MNGGGHVVMSLKRHNSVGWCKWVTNLRNSSLLACDHPAPGDAERGTGTACGEGRAGTGYNPGGAGPDWAWGAEGHRRPRCQDLWPEWFTAEPGQDDGKIVFHPGNAKKERWKLRAGPDWQCKSTTNLHKEGEKDGWKDECKKGTLLWIHCTHPGQTCLCGDSI